MTAAAAVCTGKWGSARSQYCVLSGSHEQHRDSQGRTWGRRRGAKPEPKPEPFAIRKARESLAEFEAWDGSSEQITDLLGRTVSRLESVVEAWERGELR